MNKYFLAALGCLSLAGCQTASEEAASLVGQAAIINSSGEEIGRARLFALYDELTINVSLNNAPAGVHAVHLHSVGNCTAPDFGSAGGHLNPDAAQHGKLNPQGAHLGDLPNLTVSNEGGGTMSALLNGTARVRLAQIFDADGTAIVVHDRPDDYHSDPTGAAGSRIACGVFVPA